MSCTWMLYIGLFRQAEGAIGGSAGLGLASEEEGSVLVCRASRIEGNKEGPGIHRLGLAAQVGLAPHGATEADTVYEIVAGAGQVSMVLAQDRRHSLEMAAQARLGALG